VLREVLQLEKKEQELEGQNENNMANDDVKKPLKDWAIDFLEATGTISNIIRNLALALIGIIWIFKNTKTGDPLLPEALILPVLLIVLALGCDLLQYCWYALVVRIYYQIEENKFDKNTSHDISDVTMPWFLEVFTSIFFIAKIGLTIWAYVQLYLFLADKL
jgi:hypothetical protein